MTRRVVVVGNGMAAARLVDELRRRDPDGAQVAPLVLGEEPHPAYNRVLLSTVIAGGLDVDAVRLAPRDWHTRHGVEVRTGVRVTGIDREHRTVTTDDGGTEAYDVLVLATGSTPVLPDVPGLVDAAGAPAAGVVVFRTVDDCHAILDAVAAAGPGVRVAVLGGGLLGLEAARGLLGRGAEVTVVHHRRHPMERQLDPGAGAVLTTTLRRLGVNLRLSASAVDYRPGFPRGRGLVLDDGSFLAADLLVVATGVRPRVDLARSAGLAVDRAVLVDDVLRTSDRRVRAIGECSQHRGEVHGLVAPAWEQAGVVADLLTGSDPEARYTGSRLVTRLKAHDVDLAAMGDTSAEPADSGTDGLEVLSLADPTRGRYAKLVLRDDRVVGAVLLGSPEAAAAVTQLYDRQAPAPTDRVGLLLGRPADGGQEVASPARMPGRAVVCRCNSVTKNQVVTAWRAGARSPSAVATATRASTGCGSCAGLVDGLCAWLGDAEPAELDGPPVEAVAGAQEGAA
ncbi:FAD-dependent oxidoreductase [Rhodococcus aerolatus]